MRLRIVVDGAVLRVADEDPGIGLLTYVCSVCCHEPAYDDPETCPEHPNAPVELVRKLTADMLKAAQVETAGSGTPHIAAHRQIELISIAAQPATVARQTEPARIAVHRFQTFLPFLGGMPRTAQLCQRNEWAECRLRNGLPVTADMDPTAIPGRT